ncbi:tetratricopeptide repeat protein [Lysinibacillus fusiformis]|nr:tetratricopeptide repeat protein [Lysinibacillus fusiformis]
MNLKEFKNTLSIIQDSIYFDENDYLREKTPDSTKLEQFILDAESLMKDTVDVDEKYLLMGTLGNLYRIYGNPQKACKLLEGCVSIASKDGNKNRMCVSLIRLGEALKYNHNHQKALEIFDQALALCKDSNLPYLDFALQHKGKCLMEMNQLTKGKKCLTEALVLREQKGDGTLIESTKIALEFLEKLKNKR